MYSGKTSELLRRYNRYKIANKKCLLVKYDEDNRYSKDQVTTHDNVSFDAIKTKRLVDIEDKIDDYEVICIDEIQFYEDAYIYCNKWANKGKIIETCGLNGDYKQEPFKQISKIIPQIDSLLHLKAVDKRNGKDAPFTIRLFKSDKQKLIGGLETYDVVSRNNI